MAISMARTLHVDAAAARCHPISLTFACPALESAFRAWWCSSRQSRLEGTANIGAWLATAWCAVGELLQLRR
jgi:hypothetical protein